MRNTLIALLLLLPTLALAGPKEIQGTWKMQLSAEEQAQVNELIKQAEANPEDGMAKAMLKALLAATEAEMEIKDDSINFTVMGETDVTKYTSATVAGGWELSTTNPQGEKQTIKTSITADGLLQMTDAEGKAMNWKRVQAAPAAKGVKK